MDVKCLAVLEVQLLAFPPLSNVNFNNYHLIQVAKEGIQLPSDRTICPLCSERRANPSVVTVSGFVFCYGCIFKYVSQVRLSKSCFSDVRVLICHWI